MKTEQILDELTKFLFTIIDIEKSLSILTPSLSVNYYKVFPININLQTEFNIQNGSTIKFDSYFSNLLENYFDQILFIKVIFNILNDLNLKLIKYI